MIRLLILSFGFLFSAGGGEGAPEQSWLSTWLLLPSPGLLVWTIITFLIVKKKAWGPLMNALEDREKKIEEALATADKAKEDSQNLSAEIDKMKADSQAERQQILADAKKDADNLMAKKESEANQKYDQMIDKAKKEIESEKAKALKDIKSVAVNLSIEAASKIINKNLDSNDNKKIAEDTINSIN
jgi:F-type H+-transporting ATPase subunit b